MSVIGLLHPGAMGATVGAALASTGNEVRWVEEGRSSATRDRAQAFGLLPFPSLGAGLDGVQVVVSVCPPASALDVADAVASLGFGGVYVDANAVAPSTARAVADRVRAAGATPVDGGIVGPPATRPGTTRLYLSGDAATEVSSLFVGSMLEAIVVDGQVGAASATKVAYAAWTKGTSALLLAIAAYAEAEGVTDALRSEWSRSQPDLDDRLALVAAGVAPKAWRFTGELEDSAWAFADAGLPDGFGRAAADVYRRLVGFRDSDAPAVSEVVGTLVDSLADPSDGAN